MIYEYHFVRAEIGTGPQPRLVEDISVRVAPAARAANGEVVGYFAPALGFSAREAAILLRWQGATVDVWKYAQAIETRRVDRLTATVRPAATDIPRAGGIYVHRWFVVRERDSDEFVTLSNSFWQGGFEQSADTQIFGLFAAERTPADGDNARLLLMTWYASHAEWDKSRQQSPEAAAISRRRNALTLDSWAASTRLAALG